MYEPVIYLCSNPLEHHAPSQSSGGILEVAEVTVYGRRTRRIGRGDRSGNLEYEVRLKQVILDVIPVPSKHCRLTGRSEVPVAICNRKESMAQVCPLGRSAQNRVQIPHALFGAPGHESLTRCANSGNSRPTTWTSTSVSPPPSRITTLANGL